MLLTPSYTHCEITKNSYFQKKMLNSINVSSVECCIIFQINVHIKKIIGLMKIMHLLAINRLAPLITVA